MPGHKDVSHCSAGGSYGMDSTYAFRDFVCGHCGQSTNGAVVARKSDDTRWLLCAGCGRGSVEQSSGEVSPAPKPGRELDGLPPDVAEAYDEARRCLGTHAFTATELVSRKILMHVAVGIAGSNDGQTFVSYIDDLAKAGYVTPPMRPWVDQIRQNANEATHELAPVSAARAEGTLMFTAELLRLSYEMQHLAGRFAPTPPPDPST